MDTFIEILKVVIPLVGVLAAIYNIFSTRTIAQEQGQRAKVEQALQLGKENQTAITNLKEHVELREKNTNDRLEQIGKDVAFVRDLFTKWLLDSTKKP